MIGDLNNKYMKAIVNVTDKDLKDGTYCSQKYCPIALAVSKIMREDIVIHVFSTAIKIYDKIDGEIIFIKLPTIGRHFIHNFDMRIQVSPFSFEVDIPNQLLKK